MLTKRATTIGFLLAFGAILFAITSLVTREFRAEQDLLGRQWFERGNAALSASQAAVAATDFRNALIYSRDNAQYRFQLAKALVDSGRTEEAATYFTGLWESDPGNAIVNLELARLATRRQDISEALRFYHAAIYGLWPNEPERQRSAAWLELIEFLLHRGATMQANAELLALAAEVPSDVSVRVRIADLFVKVGDESRALTEYQDTLKLDPKDSRATAGAGRAAFQLAEYDIARRYLHKAVAQSPTDASIANLADIADAIFELDPYRPQLTQQQRRSRTIRAFKQVGERLQQCAAAAVRALGQPVVNARKAPGSGGTGISASQTSSGSGSTTDLQTGYTQWKQLKLKVNERSLRRNPNLMDRAMDLVFQVERQQPSEGCGPSASGDVALALIARQHEAN